MVRRNMMEKILEIIENESKGPPSTTSTGVLGVDIRVGTDKTLYDIIFTDRRLIAAAIFSQSEISRLGPVFGFENVGLAIRWKKMVQERRAEREGKNPEEILQLHKANYEIPYNTIKAYEVKKGLLNTQVKFEVDWEGKIRKITMPIPKKRAEQVRQLLAVNVAS
jgi:hypothetical protein